MSERTRILFACNELIPFLKLTSVAEANMELLKGFRNHNGEIRILMPRFALINERRNRLHEVVRLSGINVRIAKEEFPLVIKVTSIQRLRTQVYFLDNEELYGRKSVFYDPISGLFHKDNWQRALFFSKGIADTVRKLGWPPDWVFVSGWLGAFLPFYLKIFYEQDPLFQNAKILLLLYEDQKELEQTIQDERFEELAQQEGLSLLWEKTQPPKTYGDLVQLSAQNADIVAYIPELFSEKVKEQFEKTLKAFVAIPEKEVQNIDNFLNLYQEVPA